MHVKLKLKTVRNVVVGLILVALGFSGGWWGGQRELLKKGGVDLGLPKRVVNVNTPAEFQDVDFSLFWEAWGKMEQNFYDPGKLDAEEMVYGAIEGMVGSAGDPYSIFLPPSDNQRAEEDLSGSFEGVGIQLGYRDGQLAVMAPLHGMPAEAAGVKAGDYILRIKDESKGVDVDTQKMSLPHAVELIRGEHGQVVSLTLYRDNNGGQPFEVSMARDTIVVPTVEVTFWPAGGIVEGTKADEASYPDGSVAQLKLSRFGDKTEDEWNSAVSRILGRGDLEGIVLDLRNNPGGYLNGAVFVASEFLSEGLIVKQQGRIEAESFGVNRRGSLIGKPLSVLINGGSASAAEIVSGALRDRLGVTLVGERSFGKGTVQNIISLPHGTSMHVTTSQWLLPEGDSIQETGLTPDVVATDSAETAVDEQLQAAIKQVGK